MIPLLCLVAWSPTLAGPRTSLTALAGARTAPDAGIERPEEWEVELEPSLTGALLGEAAVDTDQGLSAGLRGAAWGHLPEGDADLLQIEPWASWLLATDGGFEADAAARLELSALPYLPTTNSRRGEALLRAGWRGGTGLAQARVVGIDRAYPNTTSWSFRSLEAGLDGELLVGDSGAHVALGAAWQGNRGSALSTWGTAVPATGDQLRLLTGTGWTGRKADLRLRYRLYLARGGGVEDAVRPQFTLVGGYADDADALSAGGFMQHRLEAAAAVERGHWTISASALGRLRASADDTAAYARTMHGQVGLERELGEAWSASAVAGTSAASLVDEQQYIDVYGLLGLTWRWAGGASDYPPMTSL